MRSSMPPSVKEFHFHFHVRLNKMSQNRLNYSDESRSQELLGILMLSSKAVSPPHFQALN
jgi:hypothetical protein